MGFKAFSYLWVALKPAPKSEKRTKKRTNLSKAPDFCRYAKRKGVTSWQQFERTERTAKSFPIASRSVWNATHRASKYGAKVTAMWYAKMYFYGRKSSDISETGRKRNHADARTHQRELGTLR